MMSVRTPSAILLAGLLATTCGNTPPRTPEPVGDSATQTARPAYETRSIALPGAPSDGMFMDYLAYDRARHRVWVPAGATGSVDVIDATSGELLTRVEGFPTGEMERHGQTRVVGPSSATVGDGVVYVGNRADSTVCALDAVAPAKGACTTLESMPDGIAYVAATREVWVTTPRDQSITILDASVPGAPAVKDRIAFDGEPEGFAVDDARGLFFTNLENRDRTLAIDLRTHEITATWLPSCGEDGPKGLALDHAADFLLVACTDHVVVLDAGHDGNLLSQVATGAGVDDLGYVEAPHLLYAGAAQAAQLTIARLDALGVLATVAVVPTVDGARNAVATDEGVAYLTDAHAGAILVVAPTADVSPAPPASPGL
jgi:DNA-binding beta-propeller fold protein YncE